MEGCLRGVARNFARLAPRLVLAVLLGPRAASAQRHEKADLVFKSGAVYTVDAARSWAEAVAIKGKRIIYVGPNSGLRKYLSYTTKVIDLQGRMLLPGFRDSHVHPVTGGMTLAQCGLSNLGSVPEVLEAVRRCKEASPANKWLVGSGWDLPLFKDANPSKELLDKIAPETPVYLEAMDGHSAWVNSKALAMSGVGKDTPDPPRGRIERDPKTGEPSGTLRESAMNLVARKIPSPSAEDYEEGLRRALRLANSFGIVSLQDASASENSLRAYVALDRRGELSARVVAALRVNPDKGEAQVSELSGIRARYKSPRLRADAAKIFVDGVIEGHTAVLLAPYLDRAGYKGVPNYSAESLTKLVSRLDREGFQIHTHAIGDGAIRMSLDAHEAAQKANGRGGARHHIAHLQLIDPDDIPRFRRLGIIANFQPLWAYADSYITDLTQPVLGPQRSRWLYPIGSVAKTGAVIVGGSDWSVTSMNPLEAIQVGVTRYGLDDADKKSWLPEERADLPTLIAAYTINGAYLSRDEKQTGSIEVGKAADLVVLSHNLFKTPADSIHKVKVQLTLLDGAEVFRDPSFTLNDKKSGKSAGRASMPGRLNAPTEE